MRDDSDDEAKATRNREPDGSFPVTLSSCIVLYNHERGPKAAADRARIEAGWPAMIEPMIANVEDKSIKASDFNQSPYHSYDPETT